MKTGSKGLPAAAARFCVRALRLVALPLTAISLGACGHEAEGPRVAGWSMIEAEQRHPITVTQQPETMQIHITPDSQGLAPKQRADLLAFIDRARASDAGNSRLVIAAPGGAANEVAAMYAVGEIRRLVSDNGFADSSISVEAYHEDGHRNPPIRVSYLRYVAEGPECGSWPANLARQPDNMSYANFGCATQRNLAAQIANPADLIGPRTESDRPSERRDVTWDAYAKGKPTGADKPQDSRDRVDIRTEAKSN